jgi:hypothetical protein
MGKLFSALTFTWLLRRALELGGALLIAQGIDPAQVHSIADVVTAIVSGNLDAVSLQAILGVVSVIGGLIWNAWSSFRSHAVVAGVTVPGKAIPIPTKRQLEAVAAAKRPTLLDRLFGQR